LQRAQDAPLHQPVMSDRPEPWFSVTENNNKGHCNTIRYHSRFSPYNHAWHSWIPQSLFKVGTNMFDRRAQVQLFGHQLLSFRTVHNESENCLNCIITGDESWIHHYDPDSKHQVCSGSTQHLLRQRNLKHSYQLERLCLQCCGIPMVLSLNIIKKGEPHWQV
jgi:hypothetical protein